MWRNLALSLWDFFARHLNLIDRHEFYIYGFNTIGYHGIIKGVLSTKKKLQNSLSRALASHCLFSS